MKRLYPFIVLILMIAASACSVNKGREETQPHIDDETLLSIYKDPESIAAFLKETHDRYPEITAIETFGESTGGYPLYAFVISADPGNKLQQVPRVRLTGEIHGDEYISEFILTRLISELTETYTEDSRIKELVDSRRIVIIPQLNPDGFMSRTRYNGRGVDLNRNFSVEWSWVEYRSGNSPLSENESRYFAEYSWDGMFHLSATYHSGAVVVNLPFDYGSATRYFPYMVPAEYDLAEYAGNLYASAGFNQTPGTLSVYDDGVEYVSNSVINGGDWYRITGSLQDWSYKAQGCLDITVEVARISPTSTEGAEQVFQYNYESMLQFIEFAGSGVEGLVKLPDGSPAAGVSVYAGDIVTSTDANGYYRKIAVPGDSLNMYFEADGYETQIIPADVPEEGAARLDVQLQ